MLNREVFSRDPTAYTLPNDGVAKVGPIRDDHAWAVARYEVESFVCEGAYRDGLRRVLDAYLANLGQPTQRAVWVHGFYGSGKSHLVRILDLLWQDVRFPDSATARNLANIPDDIEDHLRELTTAGTQRGGLWSAAGTLGSGSTSDARAAILGVVLRSAGIPEDVNLARFDLWLRREGWRDEVREGLAQQRRDYDRELRNLYVSKPLAEQILRMNPGIANSPADMLKQIRQQFPQVREVTTDLMVETMQQVFEAVSTTPGKLPCVALILDELQQYLGDSHERTILVLEAVEACVSRFQSNLLFVATGQSALTATPILQKLQARFTIHVPLQDKDVETVLRQTVLRKKPTAERELAGVLDHARGEIDRHLGGTRMAAQSHDADLLVADYPLLPTRRRFWERVLRAVDTSGTTAQLRTQLRLAFESARAIADGELGQVVGGDFIFDQQRAVLLQTSELLREVDERIAAQDDGSEEGKLRARICALLFLIGKLDPSLGLRANTDTLADLLVTDLTAGSVALRQRIPALLDSLTDQGTIALVEDEYRVQTREGAEWDADYRRRQARLRGDDAAVSRERQRRLEEAVRQALNGMSLTQGASRTPRHFDLHFGPAKPAVESRVPIWVQSGWDIKEADFRREAEASGADSPIVFVCLPRLEADDLRQQIAGALAAADTVDQRPVPTTEDGKAAQSSIQTRRSKHEELIGEILGRILDEAKVFQGGGSEAQGLMGLRSSVERACEAAVSRLFPRFSEADSGQWDRVIELTRRGAPDALGAVGYGGDAARHPVCHEILLFLGQSPLLGNDIRRHFEAPECGWPRDAIDACLLVLTATGYLRARQGGRVVAASDLDRTKIQRTEFRPEQRVISAQDRIQIRGLLQKAGVACTPGDEAARVPVYLDRMSELARSAGGPPPLSEAPSIAPLEEMRGLSGSEQLAAILEAGDKLTEWFSAWTRERENAGQRLPRWGILGRLAEHAEGLSVRADASSEMAAITERRSLLAEPDPVPPVLARASSALREALSDARKRHAQAFQEGMQHLVASEPWQKLPEEKQQAILSSRQLAAPPELSIGSEDDLLRELDRTPLSAWGDKTAALAQRFALALEDAVREMEPRVQTIRLESSVIRSEADLDAYLAKVRKQVLSVLKKGRPVKLP